MRRLALAAALIATMLCCEAATPAQADYYLLSRSRPGIRAAGNSWCVVPACSITAMRHLMAGRAITRLRPVTRIIRPFPSGIESIAGRTCGPAGGGKHAAARSSSVAPAR